MSGQSMRSASQIGIAVTRRLIAPLPQPVRTAQTATTGRDGRSIVRRGPNIEKLAHRGQDTAGQVHDVLVTHAAVGEDHLVHAVPIDVFFERFLGLDGDAVRIPGSRDSAGRRFSGSGRR